MIRHNGEKFDDIAEQLTKLKARAAERPDLTQKLEAFVQTLMKFGPPHPRPGAPPSLFVLDSTTHLFDHYAKAIDFKLLTGSRHATETFHDQSTNGAHFVTLNINAKCF